MRFQSGFECGLSLKNFNELRSTTSSKCSRSSRSAGRCSRTLWQPSAFGRLPRDPRGQRAAGRSASTDVRHPTDRTGIRHELRHNPRAQRVPASIERELMDLAPFRDRRIRELEWWRRSRVEVTSTWRTPTYCYDLVGDTHADDVMTGLTHAAGHLRTQLSHRLRLYSFRNCTSSTTSRSSPAGGCPT